MEKSSPILVRTVTMLLLIVMMGGPATLSALPTTARSRRSVANAGEIPDSNPEQVRFRIKGVERGMLEISNADNSLKVEDWQNHPSGPDQLWFSFCHEGQVVSEIGHTNILEVCMAGRPDHRLVLDRSSARLFVRTPRADTDEIVEAVIFAHQRFFLRPSRHHHEIVVAAIEGSVGFGAIASVAVHSYAEKIRPHHLRHIEMENDKYARWEIKVHKRL